MRKCIAVFYASHHHFDNEHKSFISWNQNDDVIDLLQVESLIKMRSSEYFGYISEKKIQIIPEDIQVQIIRTEILN
ncbi:hypothetical protein [Aquimarina algiphila]|uniref:Uncharacterized protein n=1 Tax=Aquimarina algiphila TaxID=2047982 RepID=A0A554VPB0_9FLAO|nr:hypothetical protein [Aquimarina algiphila]TSE10321.1 hypothetical protein FOF46_04620 [Aquimarina algiphila]